MKRLLFAAGIAVVLQATVYQAVAAHGRLGYRHHHPRVSFHYSACSPWYSYGWGYPRYYVYSAPVYYDYGYYAPTRQNYTFGGALLGGILGGVIGHNSGRHGWEGAAIGAGAGLLLGSVAEAEANRREQRVYQQTPTYRYEPAYQAPPPAANRAVPQIPDAPRVPDAPTVPTVNSLFGR